MKHEIDQTTVTGSKGDQYVLTKGASGDVTCTCPGFTHRGKCRHLDMAEFCTFDGEPDDDGNCPQCGNALAL